MRDDEMMDGLLRAAMSTPPPDVSPTFVQDVVRRTAPRRLTRSGRIVIGAYAVASVALCMWLMQDLPVVVLGLSIVAQVGVAVVLHSCTRRLAT